jgi:hypothetical protein
MRTETYLDADDEHPGPPRMIQDVARATEQFGVFHAVDRPRVPSGALVVLTSARRLVHALAGGGAATLTIVPPKRRGSDLVHITVTADRVGSCPHANTADPFHGPLRPDVLEANKKDDAADETESMP